MSILSKAIQRINLKAVVSTLVSASGLLAQPEILNILPRQYALIVSAIGVVAQSISAPIKRPKWKERAKEALR